MDKLPGSAKLGYSRWLAFSAVSFNDFTLVWFVYFHFPCSQMGSQVQPRGLPVNLIMRLKVHLQ